MLSKSFIENKLKEIAKAKEQLVANLNALAGAEQAYREMLAACKAEEVGENPDTEEVSADG
jgi:hypothetical protein